MAQAAPFWIRQGLQAATVSIVMNAVVAKDERPAPATSDDSLASPLGDTQLPVEPTAVPAMLDAVRLHPGRSAANARLRTEAIARLAVKQSRQAEHLRKREASVVIVLRIFGGAFDDQRQDEIGHTGVAGNR